jgi:hypothetical protein
MKLREFVCQALKDVVKGVKDAQMLEEIGGYIAPSGVGGHQFSAGVGIENNARITSTVVSFDITVEVEEVEKKGKKGALKVSIPVLEISGTAGSEGQSKSGLPR